MARRCKIMGHTQKGGKSRRVCRKYTKSRR